MGVSTGVKIGLTAGTRVTLASLSVSAPVASYKPAARVEQTGAKTFVRLGSASAKWSWPHLTQAEIDILRAYCPDASAEIYISTPINSGRVLTDFASTVKWKEGDESGTGFELEFFNLVAG